MGKKKYKIVLTGPESTGKTDTAKYLTNEFNALYLPEYAREYLEKHGGKYTYKDVEFIAKKQLELEKEYFERAERMLIVDTSFIVLKVWFEFVFGKKPAWLNDAILEYKADLYILTNTEIEWEYDPLRENPGETRELLFQLYKNELEKYNFNYKILTGKGKTRIKNAKKIVLDFLYSNK